MDIKMIYNTASNWQHYEPSPFKFWEQASSGRGVQGKRKMKTSSILESRKEKWLGLKGKPWQALMLEQTTTSLVFPLPFSHLHFLVTNAPFLSFNFLSYPWILKEWMKEPKHGLCSFRNMPSVHKLVFTWLCSRMNLFHMVERGSCKYISMHGIPWFALINSLYSQTFTSKTKITPLTKVFNSPTGMASTSAGSLEAPRTS